MSTKQIVVGDKNNKVTAGKLPIDPPGESVRSGQHLSVIYTTFAQRTVGKEPMMTVTNTQSGTNVHAVADGIYRINTPVKIPGAGGFSFNQYLIGDDEPLLYHAGIHLCTDQTSI